MPVTHNKNLNPLLNLLINCISARLVPRILPTEDEYAFLCPNFLLVGLRYFCSNSLLKIFSFLIVLPEVFLSKQL